MRTFEQDAEILQLPNTIITVIQNARSEADARWFHDVFQSEIRRCLKEQLFEYHPDRGGNVEAYLLIRETADRVLSPSWAVEVWAAGRTSQPAPSCATREEASLDGVFEMREPAFLRRM